MATVNTALGLTVQLQCDFETAHKRTVDALKTEGFGVLTEIDVKQTMKQKLDVDFRPYKILGACNPPLAHQALTLAPEVGLLLPCNVTIAYVDDQLTEVSVVNPLSLINFVNRVELQPIADEANARLNRVMAILNA